MALAAACILCAGCVSTSSAADRLRTALPIVAESTRELCKTAGDGVLDAYEAHAIDEATATRKLDSIHTACAALGKGLTLIDQGSEALAGGAP